MCRPKRPGPRVAFASAGSGMHHKLCHVLAGAYNLPHTQTHAAMLPHILAVNAPFAAEAEARIAAAVTPKSSPA
jgi:maleylacetate reductase